jgi:hypothetical protein
MAAPPRAPARTSESKTVWAGTRLCRHAKGPSSTDANARALCKRGAAFDTASTGMTLPARG